MIAIRQIMTLTQVRSLMGWSFFTGGKSLRVQPRDEGHGTDRRVSQTDDVAARRSSVAAGSSSEGGGLRRAPRLWPMRHHATSTGPKIARTVLAAGRLNDGSARTG